MLRIATLETMKTEAEARRAQQEAQALAVAKQTVTRFLSYAHAKDVVPTVKKFLSAARRRDGRRPHQRPDHPGHSQRASRRLNDLLRSWTARPRKWKLKPAWWLPPRSFARDIGTQLGFGFGSGNNAVGGATGASPIQVTLPGGQVPKFITAPEQRNVHSVVLQPGGNRPDQRH